MIKLKQFDGKKIARLYNLGQFNSITLLTGGLSNFNFLLKSSKGEFIVRFSSFKHDRRRHARLQTQFKVLNFLRRAGLEYQVPTPIKNIKGTYIWHISSIPFWVYKKIQGKVIDNLGAVNHKEVAELIGRFHKSIQKFPVKYDMKAFNDVTKISKDIAEIKKQLEKSRRRTKVDKLMSKGVYILEKGIARVSKINFGVERIFTHADWYVGNFVMNQKKIVGLLDFDNYQIAPPALDIALAIQLYCFTQDNKWDAKRASKFLHDYERIQPLDKAEKYHLKDLIILDSCYAAVFFYTKMKKAKLARKFILLNWAIQSIQNLLEDIHNGHYF